MLEGSEYYHFFHSLSEGIYPLFSDVYLVLVWPCEDVKYLHLQEFSRRVERATRRVTRDLLYSFLLTVVDGPPDAVEPVHHHAQRRS